MTQLKNLVVSIQEHNNKKGSNFYKIIQFLIWNKKIIIKVKFLFNKEIVNHETNIQMLEILNFLRIGPHYHK